MPSNNFPDPETIKLIVEVAAPLIEACIKQLQEGQSKLNEVLKKVDQVFLREIASGFDSLQDAALSTNADTRKRRLDFAETQLLKNTGLDLKMKIGNNTSAYWVGLCHFGLFTIGKMQGDRQVAARHVFKTFLTDPRTAREKHFPRVFTEVFALHCAPDKAWYEEELRKADVNNFEGQILKERAKVVGLGVLAAGGVVFGFVGRNKHAMHAGVKGVSEATKEYEKITPEKCRAETKAKLATEYEGRLDDRCKGLAAGWL